MSASFSTQGYYVVYMCSDIIFQILLPYSRPMISHHVTCHVTAVSCASLSFKRKIKEKKKKLLVFKCPITMSSIQLNASTLSDPYSLFISLNFPLILGQDYLNEIPFQALVNSGSTYCFVDSKFVNTHHLKTSATPLVALCLFDSSSNSIISKIANIPIIFSTGNCMNLDFYVTLLDSSYSLVLGYNWLTQHNPLIN